jgi:serine/threonine protein kinase
MELNIDNLCPGCFADKGAANPCPNCGCDEMVERSPLVLPHRTLLHDQYLVGRVLGKPGGFGITYLGFDWHLQTRVAIKEYLPRELAGRGIDRATVVVHSQEEGEAFRYGLEQFLREARTLAQLDHPNIVRVRLFFEANGTAYLASTPINRYPFALTKTNPPRAQWMSAFGGW